MAQQERTLSPPIAGSTSMATGTAKQSLSPLRQRPLGRATAFADVYSPSRQRRSSTFSDSLDSTRQSIKSSTDDLLLPKPKHSDFHTNHEPSHWHSLPLALALFPALGGLFFNNGSAIVTDLTLLALAAIFLNWSVRLPWDWYVAAQSVQTEDTQSYNDYHSDTIIEEGSEEEEQEHTSQQSSPKSENKSASKESQGPSSSQLAAAAELRIHELLALSACFLFPAIGAWLLHHIRYQLSRPSEGLVSNYNLTIFLLASEVRPLSHLIKMIQTRTLHLQRTVATNPHLPPQSASTLTDLSTRLAELESHIADTTTTTTTTTANGNTTSKSPPLQDLTTQIRKNLQPDLDALNRAVRRYEKKATILAMQTEARLIDLEKRMTDAITLAAAAERTSQSNRQRSGPTITLLFDYIAVAALLPIRLAWGVVTLPGRVVVGMVGRVEGYMGRKIRREMRTAGRGEGRVGEGRGSSGSERRRAAGRGGKKGM